MNKAENRRILRKYFAYFTALPAVLGVSSRFFGDFEQIGVILKKIILEYDKFVELASKEIEKLFSIDFYVPWQTIFLIVALLFSIFANYVVFRFFVDSDLSYSEDNDPNELIGRLNIICILLIFSVTVEQDILGIFVIIMIICMFFSSIYEIRRMVEKLKSNRTLNSFVGLLVYIAVFLGVLFLIASLILRAPDYRFSLDHLYHVLPVMAIFLMIFVFRKNIEIFPFIVCSSIGFYILDLISTRLIPSLYRTVNSGA